jgi:hypothetical protein
MHLLSSLTKSLIVISSSGMDSPQVARSIAPLLVRGRVAGRSFVTARHFSGGGCPRMVQNNKRTTLDLTLFYNSQKIIQ